MGISASQLKSTARWAPKSGADSDIQSASSARSGSHKQSGGRNSEDDDVFHKTSLPTAKVWKPHSLRSSGQDLREYHAIDSDYVMPSDDAEQDRLALQHHVYSYAFQSEIVCPEARGLLSIPNVNVLDVGCAKGVWLNAVQQSFPRANYYGVDIAENVLAKGINPKVIHYLFGNILEGLSFPDNSFDFIYQRHLVMGLPKKAMPIVLAELIRVAKNGAWIELLEPDILPLRTGPVAQGWGNACESNIFLMVAMSPITPFSVGQAMTTRGLDVYAGSNLTFHLQRFSQNITNIGSKTVSIPLNWNGAVGKALALDMRAAIIGLEDWMHQIVGKSREEFREMAEQIFVEWGEYKSFGNAHCVWFKVVK
ncbi:hypothetical protein HDU84_001685 [Entophlyctis sp. JEL0112]|nr:hypothetical protein HDU84_001685 [Entophlyctis sp. JEL0112]